jgi:hypothetical protein
MTQTWETFPGRRHSQGERSQGSNKPGQPEGLRGWLLGNLDSGAQCEWRENVVRAHELYGMHGGGYPVSTPKTFMGGLAKTQHSNGLDNVSFALL